MSKNIDPACGTSGFLVAAGEYLKDNFLEEIFYNKEAKAHYDREIPCTAFSNLLE